jgi:hypothetical protein
MDLIFLRSVRWLLATANVVPRSPIFVIIIMEALGSSETSILTRSTRRNISEDGMLHSHRRENRKSYINVTKLHFPSLRRKMNVARFWDSSILNRAAFTPCQQHIASLQQALASTTSSSSADQFWFYSNPGNFNRP